MLTSLILSALWMTDRKGLILDDFFAFLVRNEQASITIACPYSVTEKTKEIKDELISRRSKMVRFPGRIHISCSACFKSKI